MKKLGLLILAALLMSGCAAPDDINPALLKADEILSMEDEDMYEALLTKFWDADLSKMNQKQQTVAVLLAFDAEMLNGGLCQFFVNDYRGCARHIGDSLEELGAIKMQEHYLGFVKQNRIDITQTDSFRVANVQDYMMQLERFPYEPFNEAFLEIYREENIREMLLAYVRLHGDAILG